MLMQRFRSASSDMLDNQLFFVAARLAYAMMMDFFNIY